MLTNLLTKNSNHFNIENEDHRNTRGRKPKLSKFIEDDMTAFVPTGVCDCSTENRNY